LGPGTHVFVKIAGEEELRVGVATMEWGKAHGHMLLTNGQPVLYAGEVELSDGQALKRWNNFSGTYQCPDSMAFQAGLPLDKFFYVSPTKPLVSNSTEEFLESVGHWFQKVLAHSEDDFKAVQEKWLQHVEGMMAKCPSAAETKAMLMTMIQERSVAIEKYGYASQVAIE